MQATAARVPLVVFAATTALTIAAPPAAAEEQVEPLRWSSAVGEGCIGAEPPMTPLRLAAPHADCALVIDQLRGVAGHRIHVSASFRTAPGGTANVAVLLTQFRRDAIAAHEYATAWIDRDGVATLDARAYVLPESDRLVVGVQSMAASAPIDVNAFAMAVSSDPLVEGAMSGVASAYLDRALHVIVDGAVALDPARAPSLVHESRAIATGATIVEETHGAIRHALAILEDGHSRLLAASEVTAMTNAVLREPYGIERDSIEARVGYVRIPGFNALRNDQHAAYARYLAWTMR